MDCTVLTLWLHRFASLGLKSRIDARIAPVLTLLLHRFASLGLKSRIDAWIAPILTFWLHRFASLGLKSRIDAALSCRQVEWPACNGRCRYDAASDSNFRSRKVEQFRLRKVVTATIRRLIPFFVAAKWNSSACSGRCGSEEWPAGSKVVGCRRGQDATKAA